MNICCVCDCAVKEKFFVCANACKRIVHSKCAGVGADADILFDVIANIPNFSWTCNICVNRLDVHSAKIASVIADLDMLKKLVNGSEHRNSNNDNGNILSDINTTTPLPSTCSSNRISSNKNKINTIIMKNNNNKKPVVTDVNGPSGNTRSKIAVTSRNVDTNNTTDSSPIMLSQSMNNVHNNDDSNNNIKNGNIISNDTRRNVIIGSSIEIDNVIRVADARKWFFISRLHTSTTEADLIKYIKSKFDIDDLHCIKLNHRHDMDYASFKVNISADFVDRLLDEKMWPSGSLLKEFVNPNFSRQFFHRRPRKLVPK